MNVLAFLPALPCCVVCNKWCSLCLTEESCVSNNSWNKVWVNVACWSSVLNVPFSVCVSSRCWNTYWSSTISSSVGEGMHAGSFVMSSESLMIVFTIKCEVEFVFFGQLSHHIFNVLHSLSSFTHCLCWEIGVAAWTVPVWEQLGSEWNINRVIFSDAAKKVARNQHVISNTDSRARADLIFPLSWHNFSVCTWDVDSSVQASLVVHVSNYATETVGSSYWAIVRSLWAWVTILWPSKRPSCEFSFLT